RRRTRRRARGGRPCGGGWRPDRACCGRHRRRGSEARAVSLSRGELTWRGCRPGPGPRVPVWTDGRPAAAPAQGRAGAGDGSVHTRRAKAVTPRARRLVTRGRSEVRLRVARAAAAARRVVPV